MNVNMKVEGEEDQALQYVNRFAINIPSGATAFNLNIVNPCLSNQSYILNPVSTVGQNIVTYQPSMALQSYITVPAETGEANVLHSLPVGVPVPVGLPVPAGLLPNHNFVNTSIIIGNEDCSASGVLKASSTDIGSGGEIKISYIQKPEEELLNSNVTTVEMQSLGLNCSTLIKSEEIIKHPCDFEMSLKVPNTDIEFGKCEGEAVCLETRPGLEIEDIQEIVPDKMTCEEAFKNEEETEVLTEESEDEKRVGDVEDGQDKKSKTEITWESNNMKNAVIGNDFQESLICEVEEVNDDEDDPVDSSSSDDDGLPLSVALKLRKQTHSKNGKTTGESKRGRKRKGQHSGNLKEVEEGSKSKRLQRTKRKVDADWEGGDDDIIFVKHFNNEIASNSTPEAKMSKTIQTLKKEDMSKKFVRVRSCCSKKECAKKISVKDQKAAHKMFHDLESNAKRDAYLVNCIEHVPTKNAGLTQKCQSVKEDDEGEDEEEDGKEKKRRSKRNNSGTERKLTVNESIRLEIENESNGNPKLSDEIQKAIKESLKDCIVNDGDVMRTRSGGITEEVEEEDKEWDAEEKTNWNFYVVIERCRKRVCLQFLLKLFRVTKSRIKELQKNILSGLPLTEDSSSSKSEARVPDVWELAKSHLGNLVSEECLDCNANPRHRYLQDGFTREELYANFKEFYNEQVGKDPDVKFSSYKKFLEKESNVTFAARRTGTCAECELLRKQQKRKQGKNSKDLEIEQNHKKANYTGVGVQEVPRKRKKKTTIGGDPDAGTSDDEPLVKRQKLTLTISLRTPNNGNKGGKNGKKEIWKNSSGDKRGRTKSSREKSRQSGTKGRDVWSLMLLHLETMPYKECKSCTNKKKHRFLGSHLTVQDLFEDYRRYFLKETNSELGLGFIMYEKYFNRNCNYVIGDVHPEATSCPRCAADAIRS